MQEFTIYHPRLLRTRLFLTLMIHKSHFLPHSSGIAAAWFLMKKGYRDITILEAEDEVGGKCRTVNYTDSNGVENNYELGGMW